MKAIEPVGFTPAKDLWAVSQLTKAPDFGPKPTASTAQKNGLRYERKVLNELEKLFSHENKLVKPWFEFKNDEHGRRTASPDFVVCRSEESIIFEIKVTHTGLAWWQLNKLYKPIVEFMFEKPARCVEITRSFDPAIKIPGPHHIVFSFEEMMRELSDGPRPVTLVVQWR